MRARGGQLLFEALLEASERQLLIVKLALQRGKLRARGAELRIRVGARGLVTRAVLCHGGNALLGGVGASPQFAALASRRVALVAQPPEQGANAASAGTRATHSSRSTRHRPAHSGGHIDHLGRLLPRRECLHARMHGLLRAPQRGVRVLQVGALRFRVGQGALDAAVIHANRARRMVGLREKSGVA